MGNEYIVEDLGFECAAVMGDGNAALIIGESGFYRLAIGAETVS